MAVCILKKQTFPIRMTFFVLDVFTKAVFTVGSELTAVYLSRSAVPL